MTWKMERVKGPTLPYSTTLMACTLWMEKSVVRPVLSPVSDLENEPALDAITVVVCFLSMKNTIYTWKLSYHGHQLRALYVVAVPRDGRPSLKSSSRQGGGLGRNMMLCMSQGCTRT